MPMVVSRSELTASGLSPSQFRAMLRGGRWRKSGSRSVALYNGPLDWRDALARAVAEVGPQAAVAGVTALRLAGLRGADDERIHIWTPKSTRPGKPTAAVVHESRRWCADDVLDGAVRWTKPAVAAVQAALWARSNRQAVLYLCMPVQQRLTRPADIAETLDRVIRDRRKKLLRSALVDIADGAQALSELDFAAMGRKRGWPEPTRQRTMRGPNGRIYLDVAWDKYRVVVEIDGIGHLSADQWLIDTLRQNAVTLEGARVLRIPVLALRIDPEPFLQQVDEALIAGGCPLRPRIRSL